MKILFLGYAVNPEEAKHLSGASVAGNKAQISLLSELAKRSDVTLSVLSLYPIATFPKDRAFVKKETMTLFDGVTALRVPYANLPGIKQLSQLLSVWRQAKKLADKDTVVLSYNLYPQLGEPLCRLKKRLGCRTASVLADPPIDDRPDKRKLLRTFFRKLFDDSTKRSIRTCDKLIVLNRAAAETYAPKTPYIVMEGGVNKDALPAPDFKKAREKTILYGGALTEYSGVTGLIGAMEHITDPDVILEIYGAGPLDKTITAYAKDHPNVRYGGKISNEEMLARQRSALLLVNPRPVEDEIAKVTFPSKIFEYMTSGTPVVSTKLNALTEEFRKRMFIAESEAPGDLADAINRALSESDDARRAIAEDAWNFITTEKNWEAQTERIVRFLEE